MLGFPWQRRVRRRGSTAHTGCEHPRAPWQSRAPVLSLPFLGIPNTQLGFLAATQYWQILEMGSDCTAAPSKLQLFQISISWTIPFSLNYPNSCLLQFICSWIAAPFPELLWVFLSFIKDLMAQRSFLPPTKLEISLPTLVSRSSGKK